MHISRARIKFWVCAWFAALALAIFLEYEDANILESNLKISSLPPSIADISCTSTPGTDVLTDCDFTINSADFPKILAGRRYTQAKADSQRRTRHCGATFNEASFIIAYRYEADTTGDPSFPHGGTFTVCANHDHSRAHTSLYIE